MKKTQKLMKNMINNKNMIIKTNQTMKLFINVIKINLNKKMMIYNY
jgi:hypothetical protein